MDKISIIIPVYNVEKYLVECLNSVLNQTYPDIEIIVVNDASTDHSKEILTSFSQTNHHIKVIENEVNLGLSTARNKGLEVAQGKYIYFLDSDDYIEENTIFRLYSLIKQFETSIAECGYHQVWNKERKRKIKPFVDYVDDLGENRDLLYKRAGMCWNKLYSHDIIDGLSFPDGLYYEDNAFVYPALTKAKRIAVTTEELYIYRRNLSSITLSGKFHPNDRIFDLYGVGDAMLENCKRLGTYEEFQEQIDQLIEFKSFAALIESKTWFGMPLKDKLAMMSNLFKYTKEKYQIEEIEDIKLIKRRCEYDLLYRIRTKTLAAYLLLAEQIEPMEKDNLEYARQIVKKYMN